MATVQPPKRMSIKEFREKGYLQEVNRRFLHPLGLALETVIEEDGTERLGGVWDYRDDPEGIIFQEVSQEKADFVYREELKREHSRLESFGFKIQPAPIE
jgi:hypothetical protein